MFKEINITCVNCRNYRFNMENVERWCLMTSDNVIRIDFKDGSFVEFNRSNVIVVELNTQEGLNEL